MSDKGKFKKRLNSNVSSLFGELDNNDNKFELNISELCEFKNHPFKIIDNDDMNKLIESIKDNGVLSPIIVRNVNGKYEIISGHRRVHACKQLGITSIPAFIKQDISDELATVLMVDSNIQRETILPSEKAFAYKMRNEAIINLKKEGNTNVTGNTLDIISSNSDDTNTQIHRYIRLTYLSNKKLSAFNDYSLLDMIDEKMLPLNAGVSISHLSIENQDILIDVMNEKNIIISLEQSNELKEYCKEKELTKDVCELILTKKAEKKTKSIKLKTENIKKYFPDGYSTEQMEETIISLLEKWHNET